MESWFANTSAQLDFALVVLVAAVLGGVIGVERDLAGKPVGIRTLMLVAGTSALLMVLGLTLSGPLAVHTAAPEARIDPLRVIQAIVMGIGFICAGTIIRQRHGDHIEGLTTAATILLSSAVGICVALHQIVLAVSTTLLALIILAGLRGIERQIRDHAGRKKTGGVDP